MPQMTVFWDPKKYHPELLEKVLDRAPFYAALALSVDGNDDAGLTAADFIVEVKQPDEFSRNWPELGIVIEASYFAERDLNLQERSDQIARGLEQEGLAASNFDLKTSFVWIRLSPAGFTELGRWMD